MSPTPATRGRASRPRAQRALLLAVALAAGAYNACPAAFRAVTLAWTPSPDAAWVSGYRLYVATNRVSAHHLTNALYSLDCSNRLSCTVSNLPRGQRFYFVATAYAVTPTNILESEPSNEVLYRVPIRRGGPTTNRPAARPLFSPRQTP